MESLYCKKADQEYPKIKRLREKWDKYVQGEGLSGRQAASSPPATSLSPRGAVEEEAKKDTRDPPGPMSPRGEERVQESYTRAQVRTQAADALEAGVSQLSGKIDRCEFYPIGTLHWRHGRTPEVVCLWELRLISKGKLAEVMNLRKPDVGDSPVRGAQQVKAPTTVRAM